MQFSITEWPAFLGWLIAAFGGWAAIVGGLVYFLADLFSKRTLQRESSVLTRQLTIVAHELSLRKSSYERHLELLLQYYQSFHRHYRACQRATNADAFRLPDGTVSNTKNEFFVRLEEYLTDMAAQEGRVRLVLPSHILSIHGEALDAFNSFKRVMEMKNYDEAFHQAKRDIFTSIHDVKERLEVALREFIRTEHLLKVLPADD